jgi:hypothetical protein
MKLPVVLGLAAEREFDAAADWYQQQAGLGVKFVKHVRETLDRISGMPELHGIVYRNIRCARVRRFPYNPSLIVLRNKGYDLWLEKGENGSLWCARKGDQSFLAYTRSGIVRPSDAPGITRRKLEPAAARRAR